VGLSFIEENKLTPLPWREDAFYYLKNVEEYNNAIKDICENNKLYFIDMFNLLKKGDLDDGLHPNSRGHKKIFEKVKDYLMENKII
jgi:lysophospholipase L1-like esterase